MPNQQFTRQNLFYGNFNNNEGGYQESAPEEEQQQPMPVEPVAEQEQLAQPVEPVEVQQPEQEPEQEPSTTISPDMTATMAEEADIEYEQPEGAKQVQDSGASIDVDTLKEELNRQANLARLNEDKLTLSVSVSSAEDTLHLVEKEISRPATEQAALVRDLGNDYTAITRAYPDAVSQARDANLEALKSVPFNKLARTAGGIGEQQATALSKWKGKDYLETTAENSKHVFSYLLTGGMRRVPLWNSGIAVTLKPLTLEQIHHYHNEVNHADYEYGRQFGAFYYMFNNLVIDEMIIDRLLPLAICGSSYVAWNNREALLKSISFQDYPTLLWAMAVMMYPNGVPVSFVCAEEGCGHVAREQADLTKLRLLNTDLINEEMVKHFSLARKVTDDDLIKYRSIMPIKRERVLEYGEKGDPLYKKWVFTFKEPSLYDWRAAGRDFLSEVRQAVDVKDADEVTEYMIYNYLRTYKPWIDKISLTVYKDGEPKTAVLHNDGEPDNDTAIYDCLNELHTYHRVEAEQLFHEYIQSSKISHLCFYFPRCPKCGKETTGSYNGYVPYDPERALFILADLRLIQAQRS